MQWRLLPVLASVLSAGTAFAAHPVPPAPVTTPAAPAPRAAPAPSAPPAPAPVPTNPPTEPAEASGGAAPTTPPPTEPPTEETSPPTDTTADAPPPADAPPVEPPPAEMPPEGAETAPPETAPPETAPPEAAPEPAPSEPPAEAAVLATTDAPPPKTPSSAGIFAQGRVRVGGTIGFSTTVGGGSKNSWFILGVGAGVFVLDGLEPHADTTFWIGDPFLATVTPGIRYVFHMVPVVKPYIGTFYRHYFVTGELSDSDSIGGRAGINFMLSDNSYVAGGVLYEHFLDAAIFADPDQVYPEIMVAVAF